MIVDFWQQLKKPIFCLAPMEEVTDFAFREMFAKYGKPDVLYTEFINVDGLMHPEGRKKFEVDLKYSEAQRPIVAQLWGRSPLLFEQAAKIISDLGFDGIDINMGCPQDREVKLGTCAALIKDPQLAMEIIKQTKKGAGNLPVSIKTRLGYNENSIGTWLRCLLSTEPAAIAVHGRTKLEKSKVPAHWDQITKAVKIRDEVQSCTDKESRTLVIGNGDIGSREEGLARIEESGCDGVMVGRGAFGNPWIFRNDGYQPDIRERLNVMSEHAELFDQTLGQFKSFVIMRKHFKAYCSGFAGSHELRAKLMQTKNLDETRQVVEKYFLDNDQPVEK